MKSRYTPPLSVLIPLTNDLDRGAINSAEKGIADLCALLLRCQLALSSLSSSFSLGDIAYVLAVFAFN